MKVNNNWKYEKGRSSVNIKRVFLETRRVGGVNMELRK